MESITNMTIRDVENMSGHVELIAGRVVIGDKTTITHNKAVVAIATAIRNYIANKIGDCTVFTENVALYCNELSEDDRYFFLHPDKLEVSVYPGLEIDLAEFMSSQG